MLPKATPLALLLLSTSCASSSGFVSSLDDLTADVDIQGFIDLERARALSLNGLAPNAGPGGSIRFKGSRSPFTAIGISNVDFDGPKTGEDGFVADTYIERRTIDPTKSMADLLKIRDDLLDVRLKASELIRAIAEETAAKVALAQALKEEALDAASAEASLVKATGAVATSRTAFNGVYQDVSKALDEPGLLIIRVAEKKKGSWALALGELLGLRGERSLESTGFALLAGVRYEMMYVGRDVAHLVGSTNRVWRFLGDDFPFVVGLYDFGFLPFSIPIPGQVLHDDVWAVTSALRAKHVLYAKDQLTQDKINANLEASYAELASLGSTVKALDKIRFEAVFESLSSLGNTGITGEASREIIPLERYLADIKAAGISGAPEDVWQVVYQVGSDLSDLRKFVGKGGVRFDFGLTDWWETLSN